MWPQMASSLRGPCRKPAFLFLLVAACISQTWQLLIPLSAAPPSNLLASSDAEVLSMFAMIIIRLRGKMEAEVPRIFGAVFECTLAMITQNMEVGPALLLWAAVCTSWEGERSACQPGPHVLTPPASPPSQDYPEHRLQFFSLLRAITNHCSSTLFAMSQVRRPLLPASLAAHLFHSCRDAVFAASRLARCTVLSVICAHGHGVSCVIPPRCRTSSGS